jgi:alkylation response protein AidB-like acyl-CoA dehydrogenase
MHFELNEEQKMFQRAARDFCENELKPYAAGVDENGQMRREALARMPGLGMLGLQVPEKYGGADLDTVSAAIAVEEIGRTCGSTGLSVAAHNSLCCFPITEWSSDEVKEKYLPKLTGGEMLGSLALTEPGAGSDLRSGVATTAVRDGDSWIINGSKAWITNVSMSPVIVTLARTDTEAGSRGFSLIAVDTDAEGVEVHPPEKKMGLRGSPTHAISYDKVRVPLGNLLGEEGQGFAYTMTTLDGGRIGIGALAVGLAQGAFEEAVKYAKTRETFGVPIADHQGIQWKLADAATQIEAARLMVYRSAWLKDQGKPYGKEAAMGKLFASEVAEKVAFEAIQIHGGYGYSQEYPVERIYRDQRLMQIGEGTSEVQRIVIARHVLKD